MGGVRYAPEGWEQLLTDQAKEELNNLNIALVDALRSTDSAFSLGEGVDGLVCVRYLYELVLFLFFEMINIYFV